MLRPVICTLLLAVAAYAAGVEDEIRSAEKAWAAAVAARDEAALGKMLSPDLIYAHSSGVVETRQQYMDRLRTGAQRYDGVKHESLRVIPHGTTAIAHATMRMHGKSDARMFDDKLMMIHVWVKQGGAWKLVAHQTTKLTQ